ncbi:MAG: hypothetical protein JSW60_07960 [Thermoplasmatales archaeon]|nr:MAG: hypothetical protein JSW60_07960 [Thermoplasmatales archaeon]
MVCEWYHFMLSMLLLVFAIASIIAGIFTAYFGSGKSRAVGGILIIIGLVVGIIFLWCAWWLPFLGEPPIGLSGCIVEGISAVVGAIIGALIALGIFLLAIMKA